MKKALAIGKRRQELEERLNTERRVWVPPTLKGREKIQYLTHAKQKLIPRDPNLTQKIGIVPNSRILFFAGYSGDWARALAEKNRVTYADAAKPILKIVKQKKPGKIERFVLASGHQLPRRPNKYDWSVSFEPWPLIEGGILRKTILRGLLNRCGAKIIAFASTMGLAGDEMKEVARTYSLQTKTEKTKVVAEFCYSEKIEPRQVLVQTLLTSPQARRKVIIDLSLANELEKAIQNAKEFNLANFARAHGITLKQVAQSVGRINRLKLLDRTGNTTAKLIRGTIVVGKSYLWPQTKKSS